MLFIEAKANAVVKAVIVPFLPALTFYDEIKTALLLPLKPVSKEIEERTEFHPIHINP